MLEERKNVSQDGKFGKIIYNDEQAVEEIIGYVEKIQECDKEIVEFLENLSLDKQIQEFKKITCYGGKDKKYRMLSNIAQKFIVYLFLL